MGRFNTVIENEVVMLWHFKTTSDFGKVVRAGHGSHFKTYAAFSPASAMGPIYAQQLSDGMAEIRKTGQLAKIMARYGLVDWAPPMKGARKLPKQGK